MRVRTSLSLLSLSLSALFLLGSVAVLPALDSLIVGSDSNRGSWTQVRESSRFMAVSRDSIWMWAVAPNANLSAGIPERDGGLHRVERILGSGSLVYSVEGGELLYDGDLGTAFDPEGALLPRTEPLYLDLGGAFRVNRLRFFPRLDRKHRRRFLQEFSIATNPVSTLEDFEPLLDFPSHRPNTEPVLDRHFSSRDVRFIRLSPTTERAWEIAELEVYGDGTVPVGEYVSRPIRASWSNIVWGKVYFEGGDLSQASMVVQTRTGPDDEPLHFFRRPVVGVDEFERVDEVVYQTLEDDARGPVKPNPAWSAWATVTDGLIRSPSLQPYLQFRVSLSLPGTQLKQLIFEYLRPPVARDLAAEIHPPVVAPGAQTRFTLSMQVHLKTTASFSTPRDTGFTHVRVGTDAEILAVEQALVDDQPVFSTTTYHPGQGFTVNLLRRIEQNGSFVQLVFTGRVFRDHTRFEVGALDRRTTDEGVDEAFQVARAADIDQELPGGSLVVRLDAKEGRFPLIADVQPNLSLVTPNGDGLNDEFVLSYSLLKLVVPAAVFVAIYDLSGRRVRLVYEGADDNGRYTRTWDGLDAQGRQVPPGLYLYEVQVGADGGAERRQGVVGVVY